MLQDGVLDVNAICISETKTLLSEANCSCSLMRREITPCCDVRDVLLIELISAFNSELRAGKLHSNNGSIFFPHIIMMSLPVVVIFLHYLLLHIILSTYVYLMCAS